MIKLIDHVTNQQALENAVKRFKERGIILPTFEQQKNPDLIPPKIKDQLKNVGLWEINPLNLFRVKNTIMYFCIYIYKYICV